MDEFSSVSIVRGAMETMTTFCIREKRDCNRLVCAKQIGVCFNNKKGLTWSCGQVVQIAKRHWFSGDCTYGCAQLIWALSVHEFVVFVLCALLHLEDALCLNKVGGVDNGSGTKGKSS
jgi:hypothetical protein